MPQSAGTVTYCTVKLSAESGKDNTADYFVLDSETKWTGSRSTFHTGAPWSQTVRSSVTARGLEYRATPTYMRNTAVANFSVGFSIAGISLSAPQTLRFGTQVTRTSLGARGAAWKGVDASKVGSTELLYAQAVPKGSVPRYAVSYSRPTYTYSWKSVRQCRGSCWTAQRPTRVGSTQSVTTHSR